MGPAASETNTQTYRSPFVLRRTPLGWVTSFAPRLRRPLTPAVAGGRGGGGTRGGGAAVQDLCERHEKGVLHEHQRALQKYSVMKRQMMSATAQSKEQVSVEQLESRIVQVASALCPHRNLSLFF